MDISSSQDLELRMSDLLFKITLQILSIQWSRKKKHSKKLENMTDKLFQTTTVLVKYGESPMKSYWNCQKFIKVALCKIIIEKSTIF